MAGTTSLFLCTHMNLGDFCDHNYVDSIDNTKTPYDEYQKERAEQHTKCKFGSPIHNGPCRSNPTLKWENGILVKKKTTDATNQNPK